METAGTRLAEARRFRNPHDPHTRRARGMNWTEYRERITALVTEAAEGYDAEELERKITHWTAELISSLGEFVKQSVRDEASWPDQPSGPVPPGGELRKCNHCGLSYRREYRNRRYCERPECKTDRKRVTQARYAVKKRAANADVFTEGIVHAVDTAKRAASVAWGEGEEKICEKCEKPFRVPPDKRLGPKRRYCDREECQTARRREANDRHYREKVVPRVEKAKKDVSPSAYITCGFCEKRTVVPRDAVKRTRYCKRPECTKQRKAQRFKEWAAKGRRGVKSKEGE